MKQHFLLAEDDENLGALLSTYLNSKGFQTKWVKNGEEAISYYHSFNNAIDFIILDVMMPEKDGFSVAKEIRLTELKDIDLYSLLYPGGSGNATRKSRLFLIFPVRFELLLEIAALDRSCGKEHAADYSGIYFLHYTFITISLSLI